MRISDWSSDVCSSDLRNHRSHCADRPAADQRAAAAGASRAGAALAPPALASQFDGTKFKESPSISVLCHRDKEFIDVRSQHRRTRSEEHTSELQSLMRISYDVFCLKK